MTGFLTQAVHGRPDAEAPRGALRGPVDSVAFAFATSIDIQKAFEGRLAAHSYSRISNPTIQELEGRVALLAQAKGVIADPEDGFSALNDHTPR